jgi:hypothetical protein
MVLKRCAKTKRPTELNRAIRNSQRFQNTISILQARKEKSDSNTTDQGKIDA